LLKISEKLSWKAHERVALFILMISQTEIFLIEKR